MALIGTIRNNGWILIVAMVMAIGGFILMDIISNSQMYNAADANTLGKVNGVDIRADEFERYRESVYENSKGDDYQIRSQVWNYFVEDGIIGNLARQIGLGVGKDELMELQFGTNLSPVIAERFRGDDGQVNRATLSSIKAAIESGQFTDERYRAYWAVQEKEIIKQRLQDKMFAMVNKAVFAPGWLAEAAFKENNESITFLYTRVPYDKIAESEIKITDDDYKAYLKDFPHLYDQQDETRVIDYVSFAVNATAQDTAEARERLIKLASGLGSKDDSLFIVNNEGAYDGRYVAKSQLPAAVADRLMSAPIDSSVGPYLDGDSWVIAKIVGRKVMSDSARARHILIRSNVPNAEKKIDSIMAVIKSGVTNFEAAAQANGMDGTATKGGDLGWFASGAMVPEFETVAFNGQQGQLYKVKTQFGWHVLEVTGKKFIKNETSLRAGYLKERIVPGKATQQNVSDKATALIAQCKNLSDLTTLASQQNLQVVSSSALKASDFSMGMLGSGADARTMIKWAYDEETEVGEIAKTPFTFIDQTGGYYYSNYVVAGLKSIAPKGAATVAALKANPRVESEVKNRKKAEVIKSKLQNAGDLNAVASQFGVTVDTALNVTLFQGAIPKVGSEPRVAGKAFGLAKGAVSKPIAGNSGVFVIQTIADKLQPQMPPDNTMFRRQAGSGMLSSIRMNLMNSIKKEADITDNRARLQ